MAEPGYVDAKDFEFGLESSSKDSSDRCEEQDGCRENRGSLITSRGCGDQCHMKYLVAAVVLACPFAARAAKLELEVGTAQTLGAGQRFLTARIGVDVFGHLTPSVRVLAQTPACCERQTWALLGELRAHTGGWLQLTAGLGLGVGTASSVLGPEAGASMRVQPLRSTYMTGDAGVRLMLHRFWIGAGFARSTGWEGYRTLLSVGWAPLGT